MTPLEVRPPAGDAEQLELWRLNHRIFAEELRQHPTNPEGMLVDKFHHKNRYIAAWRPGGAAVAMVCYHWEPPFSAAGHFGAAIEQRVLPGRTAEIRLLALLPEYRKTMLAIRLGAAVFRRLKELDMARVVISGVAAQRDLYRHMGFEEVGEPVMAGAAWFYPMVAEVPRVLAASEAIIARFER